MSDAAETQPPAAEEKQRRLASHMEKLPAIVKQRVDALQDFQKQHDELEKKFKEERLALILKYQQQYEPLYVKRSEIVNGVKDATEGANEEVRGIPDFWLLAMKSNDVVGLQINAKDEGALKYLTDIRTVYTEEPRGFKLEFYFAENPYFTNTVLTKTYHMVDDDEPILEQAVGTPIEWKEGKNLTVKLMRKKLKKNAPKDAVPETKLEECQSFFNFFNPPKVPEEEEEMDPDEIEELQDLMEQDYDIGATIRDKIVAHGVAWYTGEAADEDDLLDDEEDEDLDSEYEESDASEEEGERKNDEKKEETRENGAQQ